MAIVTDAAFEIANADTALSDDAIRALARLLLVAAANQDSEAEADA